MSLILDALKRSEQERQQVNEVPGLASEHFAPRREIPVRWLLGCALGLGVMTLLWFWLGGSPPAGPQAPAVAGGQPAAQAAPEQVVAESSPAATPLNAESAPAIQRSSPGSLHGQSVAAQAARSGVSPAAAAGPPAPPVERDAAAAVPPDPPVEHRPSAAARGAPDPAVTALYQGPASSAGDTPAQGASGSASGRAVSEERAAQEETPLDVAQLVQAARDEMAQARLSEHPAPFISELSQRDKDAIPTLLYSAHSFGDGTAPVVVINGKELRRGATAAAGVRVEDILRDSVVLTFRGSEFRLRALNSWVNL